MSLNGSLSSDDILLMEENSSRCYICGGIEGLDDLIEVQMDEPGTSILICEECQEHEDCR